MHKLLLADDSVTIQRVIELTFSGEDVQVVAVNDGEQAITRIPLERPDIVLADIAMPKRSGYDVAAFVKGRPDLEHIPVVLLAGAFEPVDQSRAEQVQCDGVLIKPFEPRQVISRVRELIEGAAARAALAAEAATTVERPGAREAARSGHPEDQDPIDITPVATVAVEPGALPAAAGIAEGPQAPASAETFVPATPIPAVAAVVEPVVPRPVAPPIAVVPPSVIAPVVAEPPEPEPRVTAGPVPVAVQAPVPVPPPVIPPAPARVVPVVPELPPELLSSAPPVPQGPKGQAPAASIDEYLDRLNIAFSSLGRPDAPAAPATPPAGGDVSAPTSPPVSAPAAVPADDAFPPVDSLDDYFERLNAAFASGPPPAPAAPVQAPVEPVPFESNEPPFGRGDESLASGPADRLPTIAELVGDDSLAPRPYGSSSGSGLPEAASLPRFDAGTMSRDVYEEFAHPSSLAEAFGALLAEDAEDEFGDALSTSGEPVDQALVEHVTRRVLDRLAPEVAVRLRELVREELAKVGSRR